MDDQHIGLLNITISNKLFMMCKHIYAQVAWVTYGWHDSYSARIHLLWATVPLFGFSKVSMGLVIFLTTLISSVIYSISLNAANSREIMTTALGGTGEKPSRADLPWLPNASAIQDMKTWESNIVENQKFKSHMS